MLEAEIDGTLGYPRDEVSSKSTGNSRNGYSTKTVRNELGPVQLIYLMIAKANLIPKLFLNTRGIYPALREKSYFFMSEAFQSGIHMTIRS
jgi:transposase-like protein